MKKEIRLCIAIMRKLLTTVNDLVAATIMTFFDFIPNKQAFCRIKFQNARLLEMVLLYFKYLKINYLPKTL